MRVRMQRHMLGGGIAALAGATLLLSAAALPARAQGPGGSYLETCRDVRGFGDSIIAVCRRVDGSWARTALRDIDRCTGYISNQNGHLACARGGPQYGWERRHGRFEGYGSSYGPRYNEYYGR